MLQISSLISICHQITWGGVYKTNLRIQLLGSRIVLNKKMLFGNIYNIVFKIILKLFLKELLSEAAIEKCFGK